MSKYNEQTTKNVMFTLSNNLWYVFSASEQRRWDSAANCLYGCHQIAWYFISRICQVTSLSCYCLAFISMFNKTIVHTYITPYDFIYKWKHNGFLLMHVRAAELYVTKIHSDEWDVVKRVELSSEFPALIRLDSVIHMILSNQKWLWFEKLGVFLGAALFTTKSSSVSCGIIVF